MRKKVGNPVDFFDKTFDEYQEGFSANGLLKQQLNQIDKKNFSGESWLGLDRIHGLTIQQYYQLKITLTDFDGKKYVAVYDEFKVRQTIHLPQTWSPVEFISTDGWRSDLSKIMTLFTNVIMELHYDDVKMMSIINGGGDWLCLERSLSQL